ncbi:MAG: M23 family metallopeptidase [Cyanobacteria bacterium J06623_7]
MLDQNAVLSRPLSSRSAAKLANRASFKFGMFISLAALTPVAGWHKPANALNLGSPLVPQRANFSGGVNSATSLGQFPLFSPIINLLALTTESPEVRASEIESPQIDLVEHSLALEQLTPPTQPVAKIYQVKQGDTINKIAGMYGVSVRELVKLNQIANANTIFVDQRLEIPSGAKTLKSLTPKAKAAETLEEDPYIARLKAEIDELRAQYQQEQESGLLQIASDNVASAVEPETQPQTSTIAELTSQSESSSEASLPVDSVALVLPPLSNDKYLPEAFDGYIWPTQGVLTSGYGWRWGRMHRGIDIGAPIGTPIVASAAGKVIGAGWHSGYGNLIRLEHLDGSQTYYAHLDRFLVTHGQQVRQGEQIATMGNTGRSTGPHLHFEIRLSDRTIIDPLILLGSR